MHLFWGPIVKPVLDAIDARKVIEIGADAGLHSAKVARWCRARGATLDVIDPAPSFDAEGLAASSGGLVRFHRAFSLEVLDDLLPADLVLIDGDHNWHTVYHELMALYSTARPAESQPITILHDIGWPYGRRDLYYFPDSVPADGRQPMRRGGLLPGERGLAAEGLNADFWHAEREGGPRNGVRTAVEDAVRARDDLKVIWLDVLHGLAIVAPVALIDRRPKLAALLDTVRIASPWRELVSLCELSRASATISMQRLAALTGDAPETPPAGKRSYRVDLDLRAQSSIQAGTMRFRYKGRSMLLNPFDMASYQSLIEALRPRTIFEIGGFEGGRSLWLADQLAAHGVDGRVIVVDRTPPKALPPTITAIRGEARALGDVLDDALMASAKRPFLVIEDAAHDFDTTTAVLDFFDPRIGSGDYLVVEDGASAALLARSADGDAQSAVSSAIAAFLARRGSDYEIDATCCDRFGYNFTNNPNGWLRRR